MLVICHDAIERARGAARPSMHSSVDADIQNILGNKSVQQLRVLQESILKKLTSGQSVDVEYWEALLKALAIYMARVGLA